MTDAEIRHHEDALQRAIVDVEATLPRARREDLLIEFHPHFLCALLDSETPRRSRFSVNHDGVRPGTYCGIRFTSDHLALTKEQPFRVYVHVGGL